MKQSQEPAPEADENAETVRRFRTFFPDANVLEMIKSQLRKENLITGANIIVGKIDGTYEDRGEEKRNKLSELEIIVPLAISPENKKRIYDVIENIIGKKWNVPFIIEDTPKLNKDSCRYIEGLESENSRLRRLHRKIRTVMYGLLAGIGLTVTTGGPAYYMHSQKVEAVKQAQKDERERIYEQIHTLERRMEEMTRELNYKLVEGKPLKIKEGEFTNSIKEVDDIRDQVRELEFAIRKLKGKK